MFKVINRTLMGNRGNEKNKCNYYFCQTCFMINLTLKHNTTKIPFSILFQILASPTKK